MLRWSMLFCFLVGGWQVSYYASVAAIGPLIPLDLMSTPDGHLFYVQVNVTNPNEMPKPVTRPFNLLVCTTYETTWIPSVEVSPTRGYPDNRTNSLRRSSLLSGAGFMGYDYHFYTDLKVRLGSRSVEGHTFAVARSRNPTVRPFEKGERTFGLPKDSNLDGALGLAGDTCYDAEFEFLFGKLYQTNQIDSLAFSLYINNTALPLGGPQQQAEHQQAAGALILGGVDNKYFTGDISYVSMNDDLIQYYPDGQVRHAPFWGSKKSLTIRSIQLDWTRTNGTREKGLQLPEAVCTGRINVTTTRVSLKLDSSTKLFVGQAKILDRIHLDHIGAIKVGLKGMYVFNDCHLDNKPDLVFLVGASFELSIRPSDYVIEHELDGRRRCLSAFKPAEKLGWVFGTKFLRKYYTVFDYHRERVGFATPI